MNWEDTVMNLERMKEVIWAMGCKAGDEGVEITNKLRFEAIAQAQAEISFKAGRESMLTDIPNAIALARKNGIREVVGWIDKPCPHTGGLEEQQMRAMDCPRCWEDAKKEWGIDEVEL